MQVVEEYDSSSSESEVLEQPIIPSKKIKISEYL